MLYRETLVPVSQVYAIVLQEPKVAFNAAEMRRLLTAENLAPGVLLGFSDEDLTALVNKGLRSVELLRTADRVMLEKPPALPDALINNLLAKFNPDALTAGTGGVSQCGTPELRPPYHV